MPMQKPKIGAKILYIQNWGLEINTKSLLALSGGLFHIRAVTISCI